MSALTQEAQVAILAGAIGIVSGLITVLVQYALMAKQEKQKAKEKSKSGIILPTKEEVEQYSFRPAEPGKTTIDNRSLIPENKQESTARAKIKRKKYHEAMYTLNETTKKRYRLSTSETLILLFSLTTISLAVLLSMIIGIYFSGLEFLLYFLIGMTLYAMTLYLVGKKLFNYKRRR